MREPWERGVVEVRGRTGRVLVQVLWVSAGPQAAAHRRVRHGAAPHHGRVDAAGAAGAGHPLLVEALALAKELDVRRAQQRLDNVQGALIGRRLQHRGVGEVIEGEDHRLLAACVALGRRDEQRLVGRRPAHRVIAVDHRLEVPGLQQSQRTSKGRLGGGADARRVGGGQVTHDKHAELVEDGTRSVRRHLLQWQREVVDGGALRQARPELGGAEVGVHVRGVPQLGALLGGERGQGPRSKHR